METLIKKNSSDETQSKKQHVCKICKKGFGEERWLNLHSAKVHNDENWISVRESRVCEYCDKTLSSKGNLDTHLKRKHMKDINPEIQADTNADQMEDGDENDAKIECELGCGKKFKIRKNMKTHMRLTHNGKRFKCNGCDKMFFSQANLERHQDQVHGRNEKVPCNVCSKTFKNNEYLLTHLEKCGKHKCDICNESFYTGGKLRFHIKKEHEPTVTKVHKCSVCSYTFKRGYELKNHFSAVHEKQKPHHCDICNKDFAKSTNYFKQGRRTRGGRRGLSPPTF